MLFITLNQLDDETLQAYKQLWQRFSRKKMVFNLAAQHFRILETTIFILPLLLLQITNAVIPHYLGESAANPTTSTIAAISAGWIALQSKVRWGELSQKYENLAGTYGLLVSEAYFKMTQHQIRSNDISKEESDANMLSFLEYCQNLEKNARAGVPVVPRYIEKKVANLEARNQLKKLKADSKISKEKNVERWGSEKSSNAKTDKIASNAILPENVSAQNVQKLDDDAV